MSAPILHLTILQKLVFLVNSRLGLFTATDGLAPPVPLLPKLRGHFAEFLNKGSSARLGILYLPTCVGFGTGALVIDSDFSWQFEIGYFSTHVFDTYHTSAL